MCSRWRVADLNDTRIKIFDSLVKDHTVATTNPTVYNDLLTDFNLLELCIGQRGGSFTSQIGSDTGNEKGVGFYAQAVADFLSIETQMTAIGASFVSEVAAHLGNEYPLEDLNKPKLFMCL